VKRTQGRRTICAAALAVAALVFAVGAAVALAAPGSLTFVEQQKDGVGGTDGLDAATHVAVSPDGRHVYVAAFLDDAVAAFSRNSGTGTLAFVEQEKDGVSGVNGLDGASGVVVSPDGKHVYVASDTDNAVAAFSRDPASGALTFIQSHTDGVGGVDGLDGALGASSSPDGKNIYVTGPAESAVAVFSRDTASGALSFVEVHKDGVGGLDGIGAAELAAPSPDGGHVYVTGPDDDAVVIFARDAATGALTFVGSVKDGAGGVDGLDAAEGATVSPDGEHVYVAGNDDNALVAFKRDPATGALTFVQVAKDGIDVPDGLEGASNVVVSPDGANVYVAAFADDAISTFSRESATGAFGFVELDRDGIDGVDGLDGSFGLAAACDGRSVYAAGFIDDALAVFSREGGAPGTCAPDLELVATKQKIDKAVEATATCGDEACSVEVTGKLKGVRKKPPLKPAAEEIEFDEDQALSLGLGKRVRKKAKAARKEGEKVFAKLTATASDLAGNDASPEKIKIKLK
jgi:DNA-binding beta-propeller fold protein YncE